MKAHNRWWLLAPPLAAVLVFWTLGRAVLPEAAGAQSPQAASTESAEDYKPVAPHEIIMHWHKKVFGDLNLSIARQKKEEAVERAWLLAELANINRMHGKKDDYREFAAKLRDTAVKLAAAAEKEDFAQARTLGKQIGATCKACHNVYRE